MRVTSSGKLAALAPTGWEIGIALNLTQRFRIVGIPAAQRFAAWLHRRDDGSAVFVQAEGLDDRRVFFEAQIGVA